MQKLLPVSLSLKQKTKKTKKQKTLFLGYSFPLFLFDVFPL